MTTATKTVRQKPAPVAFTFTIEKHKADELATAAFEIGIDRETLMRLMMAAFLEMYAEEKKLLLPLMLSQVE